MVECCVENILESSISQLLKLMNNLRGGVLLKTEGSVTILLKLEFKNVTQILK